MSGEEDKEGRLEEKDIGPVDNSALCSATGEVTTSLIEHVDCEFVPEDVWNLLEQWYVRHTLHLGAICGGKRSKYLCMVNCRQYTCVRSS